MDDESRIEERKKNLEDGDDEGSNLTVYAAAAGILIIAGVVGYVFLQSGGSSPSSNAGTWSGVKPGDTSIPSLVSANASTDDALTVTYYGDFQCPHCKDFEEQYLPDLVENYVKPGKIKFEFRAVNFLNQASVRTAQASFWVWNHDRDNYWRYQRKLFQEQSRTSWAQPSQLQSYAEDVGISNATGLASAVRNNQYGKQVTQNRRKAQQQGVSATPQLVINGTVVTSTRYQKVKNTLDQELGSD